MLWHKISYKKRTTAPLSLLFTALAFAQDTTDPITDKMRYELAAAQRDYLIARQQFEQAAALVRTKLGEAEKACGARRFDMQSFHCVEAAK